MADVSVSIVIDQDLYTRIEQEAAEREQSPGEAIAQVLADVYGHAASQAQASQAAQQPAPAAASVQQPSAAEPNPIQPGAPTSEPPSPAASAEVAGPAEPAEGVVPNFPPASSNESAGATAAETPEGETTAPGTNPEESLPAQEGATQG